MKSYSNIVGFVRETYKEPEAFIPLHDPRFIGNERKYLNECIDSNFVSSVGEFVSRFEKLCADYTGSRYAVAAMNGTAALHMALHINGVTRGDEVISQSLTFIATANAISYTGAHPVFLDVDRDTMGLSPQAVEAWLVENAEMRATEGNMPSVNGSRYSAFNKFTNRRIAACVPMHTFGHPVRMEELMLVLDRYNIPLIEDAAESLGSYIGERHTGTFGRCGILSFNGNKVITTGGGGMILTNDESLAKMAKHLTTQAKVPHRWEFRHDFVGYNYRLTNLAAALGCAQIESLDHILRLKRDLANKYRDWFNDAPWQFFAEREGTRANYWLNVILANNREERDEILQYTNDHGIMTRPVWELMTDLPMFEQCQHDDLINSRWFADRVVNLPSSPVIEGYGKMM